MQYVIIISGVLMGWDEGVPSTFSLFFSYRIYDKAINVYLLKYITWSENSQQFISPPQKKKMLSTPPIIVCSTYTTDYLYYNT